MKTIISATLLAAAFASQAQTALKVDAAWARPAAAGQSGGGGYLRITGGAADDKLVGASAPVAKSVELHRMSMDGDVMRMRPVEGGIPVPAGQVVKLEPGGLHVMLIGITKTLKAGDSFPLTLRFEKAGETKVTMTVSQQAPAAAK